MVTVIDVIRELTGTLEAAFPQYRVNTKDLTEGFDRPSYYIDVDEVRSGKITADYFREAADLTICYFSEELFKGFLDLLEVKAKLQVILDQPLEIEEKCHATFNGVQITVSNTDKALICTCSTEVIQEIERADEEAAPMMEELNY